MQSKKLVCERIAEARRSKGISQKKLAEQLQVTEQTVVRWEKGKGESIRSDSLVQLSKLLDVSVDWLLGLSDAKSIDCDIQTTCRTLNLSEETVKAIQAVNPEHVSFFFSLDKLEMFFGLIDGYLTALSITAPFPYKKPQAEYTENCLKEYGALPVPMEIASSLFLKTITECLQTMIQRKAKKIYGGGKENEKNGK